MPTAPSPQWRRPRGPVNDLHVAAHDGSIERTVALLGKGSLDINQGIEGGAKRRNLLLPPGATPLMIAAWKGHSSIVRILLSTGANTSIVTG